MNLNHVIGGKKVRTKTANSTPLHQLVSSKYYCAAVPETEVPCCFLGSQELSETIQLEITEIAISELKKTKTNQNTSNSYVKFRSHCFKIGIFCS